MGNILGKLMGSRSSGCDCFSGMHGCNDSLFGCSPMDSMDGMFGMDSFGMNNFGMDCYGLPGGMPMNDMRMFMQMFGMMFGMSSGYQGLDLLNYMNNWSMMCNGMQGMGMMPGMSGMAGMGGFAGNYSNPYMGNIPYNPQAGGFGDNNLVNHAARYLGMNEQQVERATGSQLTNGLWCAGFVREMLKETYGNNLPDWYKSCNSNSCSEVLAAAQRNGKAFKNGSAAKPGDLIVFNTSRGQARHIGIVVKVEGGKVYTIEGNSSGKVNQRSYDINNVSRINSYIRMS